MQEPKANLKALQVPVAKHDTFLLRYALLTVYPYRLPSLRLVIDATPRPPPFEPKKVFPMRGTLKETATGYGPKRHHIVLFYDYVAWLRGAPASAS